MRSKDIATLIASIISVGVLIAIIYGLGYFLDMVVVPPAGTLFDQWIQEYQTWVTIIGAVALLAAIVWFIIAKFMFKVNGPYDTGRRTAWAFGFILPLGAFALVLFSQTQLQEGQAVVMGLWLLLAILGYYIPTALFSPSSYKYAPVGAKIIRKAW